MELLEVGTHQALIELHSYDGDHLLLSQTRDGQTLAEWNTTTSDTAKAYQANGQLKSIDNGVSKTDYT